MNDDAVLVRTLPPWQDAWSDGCSLVGRVSAYFRRPEILAVCRRHDEAYYYGGSAEDRLREDKKLCGGWIAAGMPPAVAWAAFRAVRVGGHPSFELPGVSWAFGDDVFAYTDRPAVPG